jgi:hypothetical protein
VAAAVEEEAFQMVVRLVRVEQVEEVYFLLRQRFPLDLTL